MTPVTSPAVSENSREMDTHEHGVGKLNLAIEGDLVAMELYAPGSDIVGIEYEAKSEADLAAIETALAILADHLRLFVMSETAECSVVSANAELENGRDDHVEHGDHDEHYEHDEHDEHDDHDEHEKEAGHTEFLAEYLLNRANSSELSEIEFAYFEAFENALEVEVHIVSASGAQAFEVDREGPVLDISELN